MAESPSIQPTDSNLADLGRDASRTRSGPESPEWGTLLLGDVAGGEATVKVCGVAVAMVQGHNWVPIPSKGSKVNVGTVPVPPEVRRSQRCADRLGAWPAERAGTGRRTRSSPRAGEPPTWRRGPA